MAAEDLDQPSGIEFELSAVERRQVRRAALRDGGQNPMRVSRLPIRVLADCFDPPQIKGEAGYCTDGRSRWNYRAWEASDEDCYVPSTLRIEVGELWVSNLR